MEMETAYWERHLTHTQIRRNAPCGVRHGGLYPELQRLAVP